AQAPSGKLVAVKTTQLLCADAGERHLDRFQRAQEEVSFMRMVSHPNLVPAIDSVLERHEDGRQSFHLVLPYYEGGDLLDYTRRHRGRISESDARHYFMQVCSAVSHMHAAGLIHRDLKLENLFLSADLRTVYVGDFGFAGTWSRERMQNKCWGSIH